MCVWGGGSGPSGISTNLSKVPEEVQHFPRGGGSNFFQRRGVVSNCLFPIETHGRT